MVRVVKTVMVQRTQIKVTSKMFSKCTLYLDDDPELWHYNDREEEDCHPCCFCNDEELEELKKQEENYYE